MGENFLPKKTTYNFQIALTPQPEGVRTWELQKNDPRFKLYKKPFSFALEN